MFDELVEAFHHIGAVFEDLAHEVAEWYETIVGLSVIAGIKHGEKPKHMSLIKLS